MQEKEKRGNQSSIFCCCSCCLATAVMASGYKLKNKLTCTTGNRSNSLCSPVLIIAKKSQEGVSRIAKRTSPNCSPLAPFSGQDRVGVTPTTAAAHPLKRKVSLQHESRLRKLSNSWLTVAPRLSPSATAETEASKDAECSVWADWSEHILVAYLLGQCTTPFQRKNVAAVAARKGMRGLAELATLWGVEEMSQDAWLFERVSPKGPGDYRSVRDASFSSGAETFGGGGAGQGCDVTEVRGMDSEKIIWAEVVGWEDLRDWDGKPITFYDVVVRSAGGDHWAVIKRHADFRDFYLGLSKKYKMVADIPFPFLPWKQKTFLDYSRHIHLHWKVNGISVATAQAVGSACRACYSHSKVKATKAARRAVLYAEKRRRNSRRKDCGAAFGGVTVEGDENEGDVEDEGEKEESCVRGYAAAFDAFLALLVSNQLDIPEVNIFLRQPEKMGGDSTDAMLAALTASSVDLHQLNLNLANATATATATACSTSCMILPGLLVPDQSDSSELTLIPVPLSAELVGALLVAGVVQCFSLFGFWYGLLLVSVSVSLLGWLLRLDLPEPPKRVSATLAAVVVVEICLPFVPYVFRALLSPLTALDSISEGLLVGSSVHLLAGLVLTVLYATPYTLYDIAMNGRKDYTSSERLAKRIVPATHFIYIYTLVVQLLHGMTQGHAGLPEMPLLSWLLPVFDIYGALLRRVQLKRCRVDNSGGFEGEEKKGRAGRSSSSGGAMNGREEGRDDNSISGGGGGGGTIDYLQIKNGVKSIMSRIVPRGGSGNKGEGEIPSKEDRKGSTTTINGDVSSPSTSRNREHHEKYQQQATGANKARKTEREFSSPCHSASSSSCSWSSNKAAGINDNSDRLVSCWAPAVSSQSSSSSSSLSWLQSSSSPSQHTVCCVYGFTSTPPSSFSYGVVACLLVWSLYAAWRDLRAIQTRRWTLLHERIRLRVLCELAAVVALCVQGLQLRNRWRQQYLERGAPMTMEIVMLLWRQLLGLLALLSLHGHVVLNAGKTVLVRLYWESANITQKVWGPNASWRVQSSSFIIEDGDDSDADVELLDGYEDDNDSGGTHKDVRDDVQGCGGNGGTGRDEKGSPYGFGFGVYRSRQNSTASTATNATHGTRSPQATTTTATTTTPTGALASSPLANIIAPRGTNSDNDKLSKRKERKESSGLANMFTLPSAGLVGGTTIGMARSLSAVFDVGGILGVDGKGAGVENSENVDPGSPYLQRRQSYSDVGNHCDYDDRRERFNE